MLKTNCNINLNCNNSNSIFYSGQKLDGNVCITLYKEKPVTGNFPAFSFF